MDVFKGIRTKNGALVTYNNTPLELRLDLKNHSPLGFEWGYNGSGPRQLALAMLSKVASDVDALDYYENFAGEIINNIETKKWEIDEIFVRKWLKNKIYIDLKPILLTQRFKLLGDDSNSLMMHVDDKKLGSKEDGYNTYISIKQRDINVDCSFNEISQLYLFELPEKINFRFADSFFAGNEETKINDSFTVWSLKKQDGMLYMDVWFSLYVGEYAGLYHPKIAIDNFLSELNFVFQDIIVITKEYEQGSYEVEFTVKSIDNENNLEAIFANTSEIIIEIYEKVFGTSDDFLEARFRFPEEYQSILKPYMLYFEEFLNDLCIETDVSIRREGLESILLVEPKNKNEALEKIADALKAYLCAPVIADGLSIEETLQMKTALTKLYAQCKHLESQIMYKDISLREQNQLIEMNENIISESKRILVEAGVNTNIITQKNTILLDSLKSIRIKDTTRDKKTFFSSIKASFEVPEIFSGSLELKRKEFKKENNE